MHANEAKKKAEAYNSESAKQARLEKVIEETLQKIFTKVAYASSFGGTEIELKGFAKGEGYSPHLVAKLKELGYKTAFGISNTFDESSVLLISWGD